jgi:glutathione S-transferase
MERYRAMETLNFVASELHKGIGGLFNKAMPEEGRKVIIERLGARLGWSTPSWATGLFAG